MNRIPDPGRGLVRRLSLAAAAMLVLSVAAGERAEALSLINPGAAPSAKVVSGGLTTEVRGGHGGGGFHGGGGGGFHGGGGGGFHGGGGGASTVEVASMAAARPFTAAAIASVRFSAAVVIATAALTMAAFAMAAFGSPTGTTFTGISSTDTDRPIMTTRIITRTAAAG